MRASNVINSLVGIAVVSCSWLGNHSSVAAPPEMPYAVYDVRATSSVQLRLPGLSGSGKIYYLDPTDNWQQARIEKDGDALTILLDIAEMKEGGTLLLINPPPSLDLQDREGPALQRIVVDGQEVSVKSAVDLGVFDAAPRKVDLFFADAGCPIAVGSLSATLNDQKLSQDLVNTVVDGRTATCSIQLPDLGFGSHELRVQVSDSSPFRSTGDVRLTFTFADTRNIAQAVLGAEVKVDSCYPEYGPSCLINGDSQSCAGAVGSTVTWASAETDADHWIEIKLPKPEKIDSVALYWAYGKPGKRLEAQIWREDKWVTVAAAERQLAEQASTLISFAPVLTDRVRFFQPRGCGQEGRPNLMWVGEVTVRKCP